MLLRDHPLMVYHGVRNWPPTWTWVNGVENKHSASEIGILTAVSLTKLKPANRCFLYISHEESFYVGCLLFDDLDFCRHLSQILRFCRNRSIAEIGSLDLSYTL
jgi:hypothetical protein